MTEVAFKTPMYQWHKDHGGKMINFSNWSLPVSFTKISTEHLKVREQAGLFDVSHMGSIEIGGRDSLDTLNFLTSNDVSVLNNYQAQYSLFLNEKGGIVDDIIVYCIEKKNRYFICVNACNIEKDYNWILKNTQSEVFVENTSKKWGQIAIQGPHSLKFVKELFQTSFNSSPFSFLKMSYKGQECWVCFTGYTGEKGVEIFVPWELSLSLWEDFSKLNIPPIGLGARDTLRVEKKFSLYGHEISEDINPIEAGLFWAVKMNKKDFLGKKALMNVKNERKLVSFKMLDKGSLPRSGYLLLSCDQKPIGHVTSGIFSPTLQKGIGLGFVSCDFACEQSQILVKIRKSLLKAEIVKSFI